MMTSKLGVYYKGFCRFCVSNDYDLSRRLQRLEAQFASRPENDAMPTNSSELVEWQMRSVPLDRIAHLTMELQQRSGAVVDAVDGLAMRLLLNDYTASTTRLRAVTRVAEGRMATASSRLQDVRAAVERELQRDEESGRSGGDT
jgi:hypothetical protein